LIVKITAPAVYGANGDVKVPPETIQRETSLAKSKAKARYPNKPLGNQPGGGGSTAGKFRAAYTPGGPSGS
jgi:hypothetical protein